MHYFHSGIVSFLYAKVASRKPQAWPVHGTHGCKGISVAVTIRERALYVVAQKANEAGLP